jgi:hypothetical protein
LLSQIAYEAISDLDCFVERSLSSQWYYEKRPQVGEIQYRVMRERDFWIS